MTAGAKAAIVRLHEDRDISACAEIMAESHPWRSLFFSLAECEEMLRAPNVELHASVAFDDRRILGFIATAILGVGSEPLIEYLCVTEVARNAGIGSSLMSFAADQLFSAADNIYLFVSDINPEAIRLYERLGYGRVGALPDFNLTGQTEYLYRMSRRPRQERYAGSHGDSPRADGVR